MALVVEQSIGIHNRRIFLGQKNTEGAPGSVWQPGSSCLTKGTDETFSELLEMGHLSLNRTSDQLSRRTPPAIFWPE